MAKLEQPGDARGRRSGRAFRGLALVFLLSFLSLIGLILTATALGGVEPWSRWQFIGLFGLVEAASGLANVVSPNIWRLPVAELQTTDRTEVKLAASALLLPHWGGLARSAAGVVCLGIAAWHDGVALASLWLVPLTVALAWSILAASAIIGRVGVARPDLDVVQLVVRWGRREKTLAPISIGASVLQFVLSIITLPAAAILPPTVLYRPELAPSAGTLTISTVLSAVFGVLAYVAWAGRVDVRAPREQQREAEEHA